MSEFKRILKKGKQRNMKTFEDFKILNDKFLLFSFIFIIHSKGLPMRARIKNITFCVFTRVFQIRKNLDCTK